MGKRPEDMTPEERYLDRFVFDCGLEKVEEPATDEDAE